MRNKFYLSDFKSYIKENNIFTNIFVVMCFLLSIIVILFFNYFIDAFFSFNEEDFKIGEPAKRDYVLKSDLNYYNEFETNIAKNVAEQLVLPVYKIDKEITLTTVAKFQTFYQSILKIEELTSDSILIMERFDELIPGLFTENELQGLINSDLKLLFSLLDSEQKKILNRGYISTSSMSNGSGLISVISSDFKDVVSENISAISVLKSLDVDLDIANEFKPFFYKLLNFFIEVNCFYDIDQTSHNKELALENVEPIYDFYRSGQILIHKDLVLSTEMYNKIKQAEVLVKRNTTSNIFLVFGYVLILYLISFAAFTENFIQKKLKENDIIVLVGITFFYTLTAVLVRYFIGNKFEFLFPLLIPSLLISMLITFLFGNKVGLLHSIFLSFLILLISDFSIYAFSLTLIMSVFSSVIIHDVEKRIDLIKSSGELALLQTIIVIYMLSVNMVKTDEVFIFLIVSIASSIISGILTLAILPVSEHLLKISTCFQLTELCDLNAPLLKSMLIKAPGTYAHSIAVANMAESAAQHIGANALLAKAGGYYHDIGKIDQPHYFIENQKGGKNLHDDMKPTLSVAVIKSHVKLGIEKGKNIGLPRDIIDIIEQHHGKGSIAFFLDKAKKENKGSLILTEDFGYNGPNPQSPEAAIVMLGDSVEAAVRSLKNPTISQLEKFVWELILNKLKEGMLDACGLTLSDLTTIKDSFINTLMGQYHSRIEYPTGDEES